MSFQSFLSWDLCEQEGPSAPLPSPLPVRLLLLNEGGLVDPQLRASNDIDAPSKLARYLSGMRAD